MGNGQEQVAQLDGTITRHEQLAQCAFSWLLDDHATTATTRAVAFVTKPFLNHETLHMIVYAKLSKLPFLAFGCHAEQVLGLSHHLLKMCEDCTCCANSGK